MGTEGAREYTLFMQTDDGPVEISKEIADVKVSYSEEIPELANMQLAESEITVRVKYPKRLRCRSRKRFVKLLMGHGIKRNEAQNTAKLVEILNGRDVPNWMRESYQSFLMRGWFGKTLLNGAGKGEADEFDRRAGGGVEAGV